MTLNNLLISNRKLGDNKLLSRQDLEELSTLNITDMNKQELQDVSNIVIDESLPIKERLELYLQAIKNPYCFIVDGTPVTISYTESNITLDEALMLYLIKLKDLND